VWSVLRYDRVLFLPASQPHYNKHILAPWA
jgi:hypothetical protein